MSIKKKAIITLLTATTLSSNLSLSFAAEKSNSSKTREQIKEIQSEKNDLNKKAQVLNTEIDSKTKKINEVKNNLETVLKKKIENEKLLIQVEKDLKKGIENLKQQVTTYYMNSYSANKTALESLIKSVSVSDYIVTSNHLQYIVEDQDEKVNTVKGLLEKQKEVLKTIKENEKELTSLQNELNKEMDTLENEKANYNSKMRELNKEEEQLQDILVIQKEEEDRIRREILAAQQASKKEEQESNKNTNSNNVSQGSTTSNNSQQTSSNSWLSPLKSYTAVTSLFGPRTHPVTGKYTNHGGMDIAAPTGTSVYSARAGKVITSQYSGSYGNYIIVDHGDGYATLYAHLSERIAIVGNKVSAGQLIGKVGSTGRSTGPHLHLELRKNGERIDPQAKIKL